VVGLVNAIRRNKNSKMQELYLRNNTFGVKGCRALRELEAEQEGFKAYYFVWADKLLEIAKEEREEKRKKKEETKRKHQIGIKKRRQEQGRTVVFIAGGTGIIGRPLTEYIL